MVMIKRAVDLHNGWEANFYKRDPGKKAGEFDRPIPRGR